MSLEHSLHAVSMIAPGLLLAWTLVRVPTARERRLLLRSAGWIALLVALVLADRWALGFKSKDLLCLHREFAAEAAPWAGGQPLVSTATGLGKPLLAFPVSAYYAPFGFTLLVPDPDLAMHALALAHALWAAMWWWLLLARHPGTRGGSRGRGWMLALAALATANGFVVTRFFGYAGPEYAFGAGWIPSILYAIQELLRGRRAVLPLAVLFGLSATGMFAIAPNLSLGLAPVFVLFALAVVAEARPVRRGARLRRLVGVPTLIALALAALFVASEAIPGIEALRGSDVAETRGFTSSYRFDPYTTEHLWRTFTGLGWSAYGREPVVHLSFWFVAVVPLLLWRRVRVVPAAASALLLLGALDWATGGPLNRLLAAALPGAGFVSMSPTVQGLFALGLVGMLGATVSPARWRGPLGGAVAAAMLVSVVWTTLPYRTHRGYDMDREPRLFAWSDGLTSDDGPPLVATLRPERVPIALIPEAIAREQGIRTVRETMGALMPRGFYSELQPARLADWDRLHRMGTTHIVTLDDDVQRPDLYRRIRILDARQLAARPEAADSYLADSVRSLDRFVPGWDGQVRVLERIRPSTAPPDPEDRDNGVVPPRFPSLWPGILAAFLAWLAWRRLRPPGRQRTSVPFASVDSKSA